MPDLFQFLVPADPSASPGSILLRLAAAFGFGWAVAWIYRASRAKQMAPQNHSLETTLVLLAILIAAVTQVIGDSVARAFSLVGALSIVRFRTVVRDTRDTAFVIFAVVVGMACGAQDLWVAVLALVVVGVASLGLARLGRHGQRQPHFQLRLRCRPEVDPDAVVTETLQTATVQRELMAIAVVRGGEAVEATYELQLREGLAPPALLQMIRALDGVLDVRLSRHGFTEN